MANVGSFRDLIAYQRSRSLNKAIYDFTEGFPREHRFELTSQLRRAAYSVPLNIAEGYGIGSKNGTLRHLRIARGSLCELDSALDLVVDVGLGPVPSGIRALVGESGRLLQGLIRSMEAE